MKTRYVVIFFVALVPVLETLRVSMFWDKSILLRLLELVIISVLLINIWGVKSKTWNGYWILISAIGLLLAWMSWRTFYT